MRTVPALPEHVAPLLAALPHGDLVLLNHLSGGSGAEQMRRNIACSALTWCGLDDADVPVTLGGVIPVAAGEGYVWQVAAPDLARHKRAYLLQGRAMLAAALPRFARLTTVIKADYAAALRHMRRLGFTVAAPTILAGVPVCHCERVR